MPLIIIILLGLIYFYQLKKKSLPMKAKAAAEERPACP